MCLHEQDHHSDIAYFCLVVHRLRIYHQWSLSYKLSPYHYYYIHGEILVRYFTAQKHKLPAAGERHAEKEESTLLKVLQVNREELFALAELISKEISEDNINSLLDVVGEKTRKTLLWLFTPISKKKRVGLKSSEKYIRNSLHLNYPSVA